MMMSIAFRRLVARAARPHARRMLCTNKDMHRVNAMFAEARLSLQDATDSLGTTYFSEDFDEAKSITQETLDSFKKLADSLSPEERARLLESNGPKMKQLEEELRILTDSVLHDH